jgi:hypothetical protein
MTRAAPSTTSPLTELQIRAVKAFIRGDRRGLQRFLHAGRIVMRMNAARSGR